MKGKCLCGSVEIFCARCGSTLFYHLVSGDEYALSAGLFQDRDFRMTTEIFIDEKPAFYALKGEGDEPMTQLTGAQVFEQYAPKS